MIIPTAKSLKEAKELLKKSEYPVRCVRGSKDGNCSSVTEAERFFSKRKRIIRYG